MVHLGGMSALAVTPAHQICTSVENIVAMHQAENGQ
jgi:hypothetical protein